MSQLLSGRELDKAIEALRAERGGVLLDEMKGLGGIRTVDGR